MLGTNVGETVVCMCMYAVDFIDILIVSGAVQSPRNDWRVGHVAGYYGTCGDSKGSGAKQIREKRFHLSYTVHCRKKKERSTESTMLSILPVQYSSIHRRCVVSCEIACREYVRQGRANYTSRATLCVRAVALFGHASTLVS